MKNEYTINSLEEMQNLAKEFVKWINKCEPTQNAMIFGLKGDLGSGKTSFSQAVAKEFGIEENVASPTFVIEKIYKIPVKNKNMEGLEIKNHNGNGNENNSNRKLIHIDAYRLEAGEDMLKLGWNNLISDRENIILVEWPENIKSVMPEWAKIIEFKHIDLSSREIYFNLE